MFGQIIDLLVKQDDERRKITLLLLKIIFSVALATKLYFKLLGSFYILSITDFQGIINYVLSGKVIICFSLFYLIWTLSYDLLSTILSFIGLWLSTKIYNYISAFFKLNIIDLAAELAVNPPLKNSIDTLTKLCNATDIIEVENKTVKAGANFYKFYDYLIDVEEGKKIVETGQFSSSIALAIQFIIIYNCFHFNFLSRSYWLLALAFVIILLLVLTNFLVYIFATLVDVKHRRLRKFMKQIEPDYELTKPNK